MSKDSDFDGKYVTTAEELSVCCALLADDTYITVDTEFSRQGSYYPILSLIQVGGSKVAFAVDILAIEVTDLKPLFMILTDPTRCKVFHAARQDLEALYYNFGIVTNNVFDTQIALQFCGFSEPPSYETMVRRYLHYNITKEMQFSDWMRRPLSKEQLNYAIADVVYMHRIYPIIKSQLEASNKMEWVLTECAELVVLASAVTDTVELLRKITLHSTRTELVVRVYRLLQWREQQAVQLNLARPLILADDALIRLSKQPALRPHNKETYKKLAGRYKIPQSALSDVLDAMPSLYDEATAQETEIASTIISDERQLVKNSLFQLLKTKLVATAAEAGIAEKLIANQSELLRLTHSRPSKLESGWRYELFGRMAVALRCDNSVIPTLS